MSYKVRIDDFNEEYWQQKASEFADYSIYQTWAYQDNRAEQSDCSVVRAVVTDENEQVCMMCHMRIKHVKSAGINVGYVQFGPLVRGYDNEIKPTVSALCELRKAFLNNYVNVLRFLPNLQKDPVGLKFAEMLKAAGFSYCSDVKPYRTLMVDVSGGEEAVRDGLSNNFRRTLKNIEKKDLIVERAKDVESFEILKGLYAKLKEQKGFIGLEVDEFARPQQALSENEKMDMIMVYNKSEPVSTVLSSNLGDTGIVLLAAASPEGRELGGPYLNWYSSAKLSIETGKKHFDLGGIDPVKNPGVYAFKSRMGGEERFNIGAYDACRNSFVGGLWNISHKLHLIINPKKE